MSNFNIKQPNQNYHAIKQMKPNLLIRPCIYNKQLIHPLTTLRKVLYVYK